MILYQGPSALDGEPIVVIATATSRNPKTGPMVQTWILHAEITPKEAIETGADYAVCGDCKHRGTTCYVRVGMAPRAVFEAFKRGKYSPADPTEVGRGKYVRIGSYGDPAAAPSSVWERLVAEADGWAGYTHQWDKPIGEALKHLCMASVDDLCELSAAQRKGWRTYRVKMECDSAAPSELSCPASKEAGQKVTCAQCQACRGKSYKGKTSIVINVHGCSPIVNAFNKRYAE